MAWLNHLPEHINPNILSVGAFHLRYYSLMYVVALAVIYLLARYRLKDEKIEYSRETVSRYLLWAMFGAVVGGRLGHVIYEFKSYAPDLLSAFLPFNFSGGFHLTGYSGMSYHGGLIGVLLITVLFCRKNGINIWRFADLFSPAFPLGYMFGRLGNFINGELYGRITAVPWGMYFPLDPIHRLRHPSQLYEALFEGLFLFLILWMLRKPRRYDGFLFSLYLIGYGTARFFIEFAREPDRLIGNLFTPGQIFCVGMIVSGVIIILIKSRSRYSSFDDHINGQDQH